MQDKNNFDKANIIDLQDILHFFKVAGLDAAVTDTPFNAFSEPKQSKLDQHSVSKANITANTVEPDLQSADMQSKAPHSQGAPRATGKIADGKLLDEQKQQFSASTISPEANKPLSSSSQSLDSSINVRSASPRSRTEHISHKQWLEIAEHAALKAQNLEELKQAIIDFDGCNLKFTAKNTCIADGSKPTDLMLIGEGPGSEEDRQALPFVGRGGHLLNQILEAIDYTRESLVKQQETSTSPSNEHDEAKPNIAYITNAIFWRPPGNRAPTQQEIDLCRPFLARQIEFIKPRLILSLGGVAATALMGQKHPILKLRGQWQTYQTAKGDKIPLLPTLHPAFLLRSPLKKKAAWQDFLNAKIALQKLE